MTSKLLLLSQLPPPVHGASIMNQRILASKKLSAKFEVKHINITTANNLEDASAFRINKIIRFVGQFFAISRALIEQRYDLVYITLSTDGLGLYKDLLIWLLVSPFVRKRVLHFHTRGIIAINRKSRLALPLIKFVLKRSYAIVLSEFLGAEVADYVKQKFILNNAIPVEDNPNEARISPHSRGIHILFISNLLIDKGIYPFLNTCSNLASQGVPFYATIAGKELDITEDKIRAEIRARELDSCVEVVGPRYGADKIRLLNDSDILLFPTNYQRETFPLVILEAFQFGVIPVCSNEAAIPEMIEQGIDGFYYPFNDVDSFTRCISQLSLDHALLRQMKNFGKTKFLERFTFDHYEDKLTNILTTIAVN